MNGSQYIVGFLEKKGVEVVFGYPGGSVIFFYDVLGKSSLKHILVRHEQGAVHAADGYARVTGNPGVCIATSGPGATNLVTGIANAYLDSIPLLAITGQVFVDDIGRDSFQEADIMGITMPITKHSYLVKEISELPHVLEEAWHVATTGRPGPVLIDVPKDIFTGEWNFSMESIPINTRKRPQKNGLDEQINKVVKAIKEAKRPLLFAGGGVILASASKKLQELVDHTGIPLVNTLMGKGAIPESHPLALGMVGMHGKPAANLALSSCDLLIGIGVRFSDRVTGKPHDFLPNIRVIHVDIDPAELCKNIEAEIPVVCDADKFFEELNKKLTKKRFSFKDGDWHKDIEKWKVMYPLRYEQGEHLKPQQIIEEVARQAGEKALVVTDVGQHQMFTAQYFPIGGIRNFVTSGGLGTMGFGLPAAVGASFGRPDENVYLFVGDGGFQMCVQELATISQFKLPIKMFVLDNCCLGMVRQWQELFFNEHYAHTIFGANPDFLKLAEAYNITGMKINGGSEVSEVVSRAINTPGPVLVYCPVDQKENVLPIIPPGGKPNEMLGRWRGEAHISRIG